MTFKTILSFMFKLSLSVALLASCSSISTNQHVAMRAGFNESPVVTPFYDGYWLLLEDLSFEIVRTSDEKCFKITVPAGFVTDLASIPAPLNAIFDKTGRYASAAILHDYLYWTQFCDKKTADRFIKEALQATGCGPLTSNTIKFGVQFFGTDAWNESNKAKENGEEFFVPAEQRQFAPNTRWSEYRMTINKDIHPPWNTPEAKKQAQDACNVLADK